jgi:hypothetical protein
MSWCLRHDVAKSNNVLVAIDDGGWDFTFDDLAEKTVWI